MKNFLLFLYLCLASQAMALTDVDKQDLIGVSFNSNGGGENGIKGYVSSPASGVLSSEMAIKRTGKRSIKCSTTTANYCETPLFYVPSDATPKILFYYKTTDTDYDYQVYDSANNPIGVNHSMVACSDFCASDFGTFTPILGVQYKIRVTSSSLAPQIIYLDDISVVNDTSLAPGESNTASNVGTGEGQTFKAKVGADLQLRTIKAGSGIGISTGTNEITINATGGGGGGGSSFFMHYWCTGSSSITYHNFAGTPTISNVASGSCNITIPSGNFTDASKVICKSVLTASAFSGIHPLPHLATDTTSLTNITTGCAAAVFDYCIYHAAKMECTQY